MEIAELVTIDLEHDNQSTPDHQGLLQSRVRAVRARRPQHRLHQHAAGQDHPDRVRRSAIWTMGADGSNPHAILDRKEYSFYSPRYTPDGASLIVSGSQTDEPTYRQAHLARFDLKDNKLTWLTEKWDSSARSGKVSSRWQRAVRHALARRRAAAARQRQGRGNRQAGGRTHRRRRIRRRRRAHRLRADQRARSQRTLRPRKERPGAPVDGTQRLGEGQGTGDSPGAMDHAAGRTEGAVLGDESDPRGGRQAVSLGARNARRAERHVGSRRIQHVVGVPTVLLLGLWRDLRQSPRIRRLRLRIPEGQLPQLGQGTDGRRAGRARRFGEGRCPWSTRIACS